MSPSPLLRCKISPQDSRGVHGQCRCFPVSQDGYHVWNKTVEQLKALADPLRIRLVQELVAGPRTVTELAIQYEMDIGGLSHHLGVLFRVGLVDRTRQGRFVEYRVAVPFDVDRGQVLRLKLDRLTVELELAPGSGKPA